MAVVCTSPVVSAVTEAGDVGVGVGVGVGVRVGVEVLLLIVVSAPPGRKHILYAIKYSATYHWQHERLTLVLPEYGSP